MSAPAPIKYLAVSLRDRIEKATQRANRVGERAMASVDNLHAVLDRAEAQLADIDKSAAEIQAALGQSNGGPAIDAGPIEVSPAPAEPPAVVMTRTPVGFVAQ